MWHRFRNASQYLFTTPSFLVLVPIIFSWVGDCQNEDHSCQPPIQRGAGGVRGWRWCWRAVPWLCTVNGIWKDERRWCVAFKEKGYRLPFLLSCSHYSLEFRQSDEPPWTLQMRTKVYRWQNNKIKKDWSPDDYAHHERDIKLHLFQGTVNLGLCFR